MASLFTPEMILSYPKLFKAGPKTKNAKPGDTKAYSVAGLFTLKATETPEYKKMLELATDAAQAKFGDKWKLLLKDGKFKWPFRKDVVSSGYPAEFVTFMNFSADENPGKPKPQVVDRGLQLITDPAIVFPGIRGRVSYGCYAYDNESKGVSFGLRNVQILGNANDKRLDAYKTAAEEFPEVAPEEISDELAGMLG